MADDAEWGKSEYRHLSDSIAVSNDLTPNVVFKNINNEMLYKETVTFAHAALTRANKEIDMQSLTGSLVKSGVDINNIDSIQYTAGRYEVSVTDKTQRDQLIDGGFKFGGLNVSCTTPRQRGTPITLVGVPPEISNKQILPFFQCFGEVRTYHEVTKNVFIGGKNRQIKNGNRVFTITQFTQIPPKAFKIHGHPVRCIFTLPTRHQCTDEAWEEKLYIEGRPQLRNTRSHGAKPKDTRQNKGNANNNNNNNKPVPADMPAPADTRPHNNDYKTKDATSTSTDNNTGQQSTAPTTETTSAKTNNDTTSSKTSTKTNNNTNTETTSTKTSNDTILPKGDANTNTTNTTNNTLTVTDTQTDNEPSTETKDTTSTNAKSTKTKDTTSPNTENNFKSTADTTGKTSGSPTTETKIVPETMMTPTQTLIIPETQKTPTNDLVIVTPPDTDTLSDILTDYYSDSDCDTTDMMSQPIVSMKAVGKSINAHLPTRKAKGSYQPLEYVVYQPTPSPTPAVIRKELSPENRAKLTPAKTRNQTKLEPTIPKTLKEARKIIHYDAKTGSVRLGNQATMRCFPDPKTFMVVILEFLRQDCRLAGQSYISLAAHLPMSWRQTVTAEPCRANVERTVTERLERYITTYFKNPKTRWNTALQLETKALVKYL